MRLVRLVLKNFH